MENFQFRNPPAVEALIDIRVTLPPETTLEKLSVFYDKVKDRFPRKENRLLWQSQFQVVLGKPPEITPPVRGPDGFLFHAADNSKIVQARLDGFTFNKLKPYQNWNSFKNEAKELWALYVKAAKPLKIQRLGLRYINSIELPFPFKELKDYILTGPEIAPEVSYPIMNYVMQIVLQNAEIGARAIVNQNIQPVINKNGIEVLPLIFDIDVMKGVNSNLNDDHIWAIFENLRNFKNEIFIKSLTEKAKELFK